MFGGFSLNNLQKEQSSNMSFPESTNVLSEIFYLYVKGSNFRESKDVDSDICVKGSKFTQTNFTEKVTTIHIKVSSDDTHGVFEF